MIELVAALGKTMAVWGAVTVGVKFLPWKVKVTKGERVRLGCFVAIFAFLQFFL